MSIFQPHFPRFPFYPLCISFSSLLSTHEQTPSESRKVFPFHIFSPFSVPSSSQKLLSSSRYSPSFPSTILAFSVSVRSFVAGVLFHRPNRKGQQWSRGFYRCLLFFFLGYCRSATLTTTGFEVGAEALARLKVYEGIPPPYDKTKRMVVPDALKVLRLQKGHKYCLLGQLSSVVGWNHYDTIKELENKRKERAQLAYKRKKQLTKLRLKSEKSVEEKLGSQLELLSSVTY